MPEMINLNMEVSMSVREGLRLLSYLVDNFLETSSKIDEIEDKINDNDELTKEEIRDFLIFVEMIFADVDAVMRLIGKIKTSLEIN